MDTPESEKPNKDNKTCTNETDLRETTACLPKLNGLQRGLIGFVRVYQLIISPFLGNNCRFYPTCSQYCIEAMQTHGVLKGLWLGIKRVSRCHPFCEGGVDPVPPSSSSSPAPNNKAHEE